MCGPFDYPHSMAARLLLLALILSLALAGGQPPTAQAKHLRKGGLMDPNCTVSLRHLNTPHQCADMLRPPATAGLRMNGAAAQSSTHQLAVYYAVPMDIPFDPAVFERIQAASRDIQAWYQVATGGVTWELAFPEVVRVYNAQQPRQFYQATGNWWGSLLPEMGSAGLPIWSPGTVVVIWAHGAGWWAGGAQGCGVDCGVVLLGVELFPAFNNPAFSGDICPDSDGEGMEAWPCVPVGAYAHELGHSLGLIHPIDDPATAPVAGHSIMQTHWNYPDQAPLAERPWGLLRNERASVLSNPFMKSGVDLIQSHQDADIAVNLPASDSVPLADFAVEVAANEVRFTNTTQGAARYYWTFGDYGASDDATPTHKYAKPGTYSVTLRASSAQAMMGVMRRSVIIEGPPASIEIPVDIKPGGCPNPLNSASRGALPVAILGTNSLDIAKLDPASIQLAGVSALRWSREDVAAPFRPLTGKARATDCTAAGPDRLEDLTLKFDTQAIVAALSSLTARQIRVVKLTGKLKSEFGGTPIIGEDVVVILKKRHGR